MRGLFFLSCALLLLTVLSVSRVGADEDDEETIAEKQELVWRAKMAEETGRYNDMAAAMKLIVQTGIELSREERNLFSVAYERFVGARRSSWRIISSVEQKPDSSESELTTSREYREKVETEIRAICKDVLDLLAKFLLPKASESSELGPKVFYLNMKGDYSRYLAEIASGDVREGVVENSEKNYQEAYNTARFNLPPTCTIRLRVALGYSKFYYEILDSPGEACSIAKLAFDAAVPELENLEESSYMDTTRIMQLLRDSVTEWECDT